MTEPIESFGVTALIGREYTIELTNANNQEADYYCVLCNKTSSKRNVFAHWSSFDHRFKYLDKHFKTAATAINSLRQKPNADSSLTSIVKSVAVEIEKKYGRLDHLTLSREEFRRSRSKYLKDINNMKHFSESMGADFMHIVKDAIANANLDGNKNINKDNNSVIDDELCDRLSTQAAGGLTEKQMKDAQVKPIDLDEISSDTDSDDSLKSANLLTQKKNLKKLDGGNSNTDSNHDKTNNEINYKKILHSLSLQASHIAQERYKIEKYQSIVDMEAKKMSMQQIEYDKNPESHPDYPAEWIKFWNRRSRELQGKNVDPNKYDYKPEWISYWRIRMIELSNISLDKKKVEIRQQLGLRDEDVRKFEHLNEKYKVPAVSRSINNIENNGDKIHRSKRASSSHHGNESNAKRSSLSRLSTIDINNIDSDDNEFPSYTKRPEHRRSRSHSRSPRQRHLVRSPRRHISSRRHSSRSPRRHASRSPRRHLSRSPKRQSLRSSRRQSSRSPIQYSSRSPKHLSPRSQRVHSLRTHTVHSRSPRHSRSPYTRRRSGSFSMSPLPSLRNDSSLPYRQRYHNLSRSRSRSPPPYHLGRHIDDYHGDRQHRDDMQYDSQVYSRFMHMYSSSAEPGKRIRIIDSRDYPEYVAGDRPTKSPVEETVVEAPLDEGPLTLVAVLRTLSALEQHLGSLGPKTLDLLSKALAIEKVKANESDSLLLNDDYCVFLETIKEKLKGLLITDLLNEPKKVRVIKLVIKNIAALIHQVNSKDNTNNSNKTNEQSQSQAKDGDTNKVEQQALDRKAAPQKGYPFDREVVASRLASALVARGCDAITSKEMDKLIKFFVLLVRLNKKRQQTNGQNLEFGEVLNILGIDNPPQTHNNHNDNNVDGDNGLDEVEYNSNKLTFKQNIHASSASSSSLPLIHDTIQKEITEIVREVENTRAASAATATAAASASDRTNNLGSLGSTKMSATCNSAEGGSGGAALDGSDSSNQLFLLTDAELKVLIKNFKFLSNDEQDHLITHLKKLEVEEPKREQSLRKYVDVTDLSDEVGPCSDVLSKLTNSVDNTKKITSSVDRNNDVLVASSTTTSGSLKIPQKYDNLDKNYKSGGVNSNFRIEDDDDDEDDYNFDEVFLNNNFRKSKSKSPIPNSKPVSSSSMSTPASSLIVPTESSINALTFKPPETRTPLIKDTESLIANLMGSLQQNAAASSKLTQNNNKSSSISISNTNIDEERFNIGDVIDSVSAVIGPIHTKAATMNATPMATRNHSIQSHQQPQPQPHPQQLMRQQVGHGLMRGQQPMSQLQQQQQQQRTPHQQSMSNMPSGVGGVGGGGGGAIDGSGVGVVNNVNMQQHYQHNPQQQQQYMSGGIDNNMSGYQQQPNIHYNPLYGYQNPYTNYQHPHGGGLWQQPNNGPHAQYFMQQPQPQHMPAFNNMYGRQHDVGGGSGPGATGGIGN